MDPIRCRYSDCPGGHPEAAEHERVTCPKCRADLGLPILTTYRVVWEIDIEADSAESAAIMALEIQRDPESIALVFNVDGTEIDLSNI